MFRNTEGIKIIIDIQVYLSEKTILNETSAVNKFHVQGINLYLWTRSDASLIVLPIIKHSVYLFT